MKIRLLKNKGFSLVEVIMYSSLLIVLITALSMIFGSVLSEQLESESTSSVDLDGKYILSKLIYDMGQMQINSPTNDTIVTPSAAGQTTNTLVFKVNSTNYTYALNNEYLELTNGLGVNVLNGLDTKISNLEFHRIGDGGSKDTIRVKFKVTSKVIKNTRTESRDYQTTISSQ